MLGLALQEINWENWRETGTELGLKDIKKGTGSSICLPLAPSIFPSQSLLTHRDPHPDKKATTTVPDSLIESRRATLAIHGCEAVGADAAVALLVLYIQDIGVFQGCFGPFFGGVNPRNGKDMKIHPHGRGAREGGPRA